MPTPSSSTGRARRRGAAAGLLLAGMAGLAGCAGYSPQSLPAGASGDQIAARMGAPSGRYGLPGNGQRIEYARGPYGRHTYMLDLDAQGRLQQWDQVLLERNFDAIRTGMPRDTVLASIGHPSDVRGPTYPRREWTIWSYRYETPFCKWFQVTLDAAGTVAETNYGPDPLCSHDGDRISN